MLTNKLCKKFSIMISLVIALSAMTACVNGNGVPVLQTHTPKAQNGVVMSASTIESMSREVFVSPDKLRNQNISPKPTQFASTFKNLISRHATKDFY